MVLLMFSRVTLCVTATVCSFTFTPLAYGADDDLERLQQLSLEEMLNVKVTSVSKREEKASEAAAAVFVITQEDIRRSGVTTIQDALRMAPGIQVAQLGSNKWAISARGFNDQLSNKLLVLMDGRTIYTPLFSGVNWDIQDTLLEDIDRIEVIRGPGAALWGANAVNGVINIITRNAKDTQGVLLTGLAGNYEEGTGGARVGGKLGADAYYRTYMKYRAKDSFPKLDGSDNGDDWNMGQTGFRVDWDKTARDAITIQGDLYRALEDRQLPLPSSVAPYTERVFGDEERNGVNVLSRWQHQISSTSLTTLQVYYDMYERNNVSTGEERHMFDMEFQHDWSEYERHQVTWGVGYRFMHDNLQNTPYFVHVPDASDDTLVSSFVQDKIALVPETLFLTLGSKFEQNDYTGFEYQPSARMAWLPTHNQTVWGAVSRAVRTPNRVENNGRLVIAYNPLAAGYVSQVGNTSIQSEELTAYELGYRIQPVHNVSFDISTFYNDYDSLRTFEPGASVDVPIANNGYGESYGAEFAANWQVTGDWNLTAAYSWLQMNLNKDTGSTDPELAKDEGKSPQNQFNIRSHYRFPYNIEFDNALYYTDSLPSIGIDAYMRFDSKLTWKPINGLELSVIGQNLFDDYHQEFTAPLQSDPAEVGRSVFGKVTWRF